MIASPSFIFRAERPFLKTPRQTCLLAGSSPVAQVDTKKPSPLPKRASFLVGATGLLRLLLFSERNVRS